MNQSNSGHASQRRTKYRIIPVEGHVGVDLYLQFEHTQRFKARTFPIFGSIVDREKTSWRFIYKDSYAIACGLGLTSNDCPETLIFPAWRLIKDYVACEYSLVGFTKVFPDIEKYFANLRERRKEYLDREKAEREIKIKYL